MISTGSNALNQMLGGGVRTGMLTDFYGPSGTGKTQLCFQLCVNCIRDCGKDGVGGCSVLFTDTTNTFRPERVLRIARSNEMDESILDNIFVHKARTTSDYEKPIKQLGSIKNLKLMIIDSLGDFFWLNDSEEQETDRHMKIMRFMRDLSYHAIKDQIAVVTTNGVRFNRELTREYLARSVSPYTHMRIELSRTETGFKARVIQPSFGMRLCYYTIGDEGITDD